VEVANVPDSLCSSGCRVRKGGTSSKYQGSNNY
jgi:hypothetical protein